MKNKKHTKVCEIIDSALEKKDIGGNRGLAKAVGVAEGTLYKWKKTGLIPKAKYQTLIESALELSPGTLSDSASAKVHPYTPNLAYDSQTKEGCTKKLSASAVNTSCRTMGTREKTKLSGRIKEAKEKRGISSYIDLGGRIGKTEQTLYKWMAEERIPKEKDQVALAVALGVSQKWLVTGEDPDGAPPTQAIAPSPKRSALFSALDFVHNLNQVLDLEFTPQVEVEEGWRVAEVMSEYKVESVEDLPSDVQRDLASQIGKRSDKKTTR